MSQIYQHFRPEERHFVEKVEEWIALVEQRGSVRLTDFLDPREREIIKSLVNRHHELKAHFFGGYDGAERSRAMIAPDYIPIEQADFKLCVIKIVHRNPFVTLEHRDYLGAILNLGVTREKFGDLIVFEEGGFLILGEEMSSFIQAHLDRIGKAPIEIEEIHLNQLEVKRQAYREQRITVSSLRLDGVVAEVLRLSRSKAVDLIKAGRVKVNWQLIDRPAFEVELKDVLSIRGFGRFHILELHGQTRKGRYALTIGQPVDH